MTVQLTDDVHWINECHEIDGAHEHVSVYLIEAGDDYILIDSGSFYHRESILNAIDEATDGEGPDALVLSHSDYPHSGNIPAFREEWGDIELVASSGAPAAQGLPEDAIKCDIGGSMTVKGREFSFIDPPLADRSHTTWIYDHGSGTLFTADGFGSHHDPGDCDATSADLSDGIAFEDIHAFHEDTLVWLRYVEPEKLEDALDAIFDAYPIAWVAPIHGHPIAGEDIDRYMDRLIDAATKIADDYPVPNA